MHVRIRLYGDNRDINSFTRSIRLQQAIYKMFLYSHEEIHKTFRPVQLHTSIQKESISDLTHLPKLWLVAL